jgi:hypothetical protein
VLAAHHARRLPRSHKHGPRRGAGAVTFRRAAHSARGGRGRRGRRGRRAAGRGRPDPRISSATSGLKPTTPSSVKDTGWLERYVPAAANHETAQGTGRCAGEGGGQGGASGAGRAGRAARCVAPAPLGMSSATRRGSAFPRPLGGPSPGCVFRLAYVERGMPACSRASSIRWPSTQPSLQRLVEALIEIISLLREGRAGSRTRASKVDSLGLGRRPDSAAEVELRPAWHLPGLKWRPTPLPPCQLRAIRASWWLPLPVGRRCGVVHHALPLAGLSHFCSKSFKKISTLCSCRVVGVLMTL